IEEQSTIAAVKPTNQRRGKSLKYGSPERRVDRLKQSAVHALSEASRDAPEDRTIYSSRIRRGRPPKHLNLTAGSFENPDASPQAAFTPISIPPSTQSIPNPSVEGRGQPPRHETPTPMSLRANSTISPDASI